MAVPILSDHTKNQGLSDIEQGNSVFYGKRQISFLVIRRKRKTLEISVLPDGSVEVVAPEESPAEAIRQKVKKRAPWIIKQQRWFKQFDPRTPPRQYLGGETHAYLGKKYRLKMQTGQTPAVKLIGGYFVITTRDHANQTSDSGQAEELLNAWYREKATRVFQERFEKMIHALGIQQPPRVQIKSMKTRWGSLSKSGLMTLNLNLIRTPAECIEYVIVHELCHMNHHNHSAAFYQLLSQRMPDWEKRKQKLEEALV